MNKYYIAWWNVENLFSYATDPERPDYLKSRLAGELKGWTADILDKKISQLTSVVSQMNNGFGPDILGVCEVENRTVIKRWLEALNKETTRQYEVAHHDCKDARGIDIAFIYDSEKFTSTKTFSYEVLKRSATRDIFQVTFNLKTGKSLVVIGNHWPSRTAGTYESEPYRIIAAETLSYWMERIPEILGEDVPILVMGDFNDDPFSRSIREYALASQNKTQVSYAHSPRMYNLMWEEMGANKASYVYGNEKLMLDQFMVNKSLIKSKASLKVVDGSCKVEIMPGMGEGRYETPRRFGRPSSKSSFDPNGYSDHFPISVELEEKV